VHRNWFNERINKRKQDELKNSTVKTVTIVTTD